MITTTRRLPERFSKRQGGIALGAVHEDGDGRQIVADRKLAAGEDRPAGDAELRLAGLALEQAASGVGVDRDATALRAEGLAFGRSPADRLHGVERFVVTHPHDLGQRQSAGGGGEKEVLAGGVARHL